jgi:hypothetical protein
MNLSLSTWALICTFLLAVAMGTALTVQTQRLKATKAEYAQFQAGVKALGDLALKHKSAQEAADKSRKAKADAENRRTIADLHTHIVSLRESRASGGFVPGPGPDARSPDRATFDRAELERAIREFDQGASSLIAEGDEHRVNLDTAKRWAQE